MTVRRIQPAGRLLGGGLAASGRDAAFGIGITGTRHPSGLLQGYRAVTLGEREQRQQDAARARINTSVYVFTRVNASGIKQLKEKWPVRGYRREPWLLWRQRIESKGSGLEPASRRG